MEERDNVLPDALLKRLRTMYEPEGFEAVLHGFAAHRKTTLRTNRLRGTCRQVEDMLSENGIEFESVPWYTDAFILRDTTARRLSEFQSYKEGLFYVQNLSSMIPPIALAPEKNDRVLDITAAPGSKTTQMAAIMNNSGLIIANDKSPVRRMKLAANLKIQGVSNTRVTGYPAQIIWKKYPEYFDKVLVDVPCSMEGIIQLHFPKTYEDWTLKKAQDLSHTQKSILRSAISAAKPGGVVVYSTCTMSPEENEDVIDWILGKEKGAVIPESITIAGLEYGKGFIRWKNRAFTEFNDMVVRVLPSDTMEGFFVAKLRKIRSTVPSNMRVNGEASF